MVQIVLQIFQRFRKFLFWLWQQDGTPGQLARGIGVGVFSGCFPFFGFQTVLGVILASLLRGNRLLAVTGTWISNPFTYVPLYWFNYKIGCFVLGGQGEFDQFEQITSQELWEKGLFFSTRLLAGSSLVGISFGLLVGLTLYMAMKIFSETKNFPIKY